MRTPPNRWGFFCIKKFYFYIYMYILKGDDYD